jgi:putative transposase
VTPTARGADPLACLRLAVTEAEQVLDLDDLRADRGLAEVLGPAGEMLGIAPAPIPWCRRTLLRGEVFRPRSTDQTSCCDTFAPGAITTDQRRHRKLVNTLKYEHLFRGVITDGDALDIGGPPIPHHLQLDPTAPSPRRSNTSTAHTGCDQQKTAR